MPTLWTDTIESHRLEVRDAILDATAALVGEHGLRSVTMSQIARIAGIGRATLYRYFQDVETILLAWHERQVARHLEYLAQLREESPNPDARLEAVLTAYGLIAHESRGHRDTELAALVHGGEEVSRAERQLHAMIRDLVAEGVASGDVRADVPAHELAAYCVHSLSGASSLPSKAAVRRLVAVTLAGLRPPR